MRRRPPGISGKPFPPFLYWGCRTGMPGFRTRFGQVIFPALFADSCRGRSGAGRPDLLMVRVFYLAYGLAARVSGICIGLPFGPDGPWHYGFDSDSGVGVRNTGWPRGMPTKTFPLSFRWKVPSLPFSGQEKWRVLVCVTPRPPFYPTDPSRQERGVWQTGPGRPGRGPIPPI